MRFAKFKRSTLPGAPPVGSGSEPMLKPREVANQGEPTTACPINQHKYLAGSEIPQSSESFK